MVHPGQRLVRGRPLRGKRASDSDPGVLVPLLAGQSLEEGSHAAGREERLGQPGRQYLADDALRRSLCAWVAAGLCQGPDSGGRRLSELSLVLGGGRGLQLHSSTLVAAAGARVSGPRVHRPVHARGKM